MNDLSITLENDYVLLSPLTIENHHHLLPIASQEKLVHYSPSDIETPAALKRYVETALDQKERKTSIPFIILDKGTQLYAGCTRYMHIDWQNKVLEIGSTWIGREFHGSGLNAQMKDLMLRHAFETMRFEKVEFRIDERNLRSRKAVEKLGAVLEGILRKNIYLLDGFKRNTCCYGILKEEWLTENTP
ncbi:MAG: GNAT family N-acetyltransferase [Maribacter sp.]|uniref:GNAT family N-acetyltransferase n=1 Tax=Maribacter sp. TaxID=1897614 RepID=UPI003C75ECEC